MPEHIFADLLPHGPYGVIYADPPWSFKVWSKATGHGRSAESHYATMEQHEIEALPVADLAANDCALFMWAVMSQLPEAVALGQAWGFEYKTVAFTWVKLTPTGTKYHVGMGYWTRQNPELCLLFTKGSPKRRDKGVRNLIVTPRERHSAKPFETYDRVERLVAGPYCELFARRHKPGWHVWGNQAPDEPEEWQLPLVFGEVL